MTMFRRTAINHRVRHLCTAGIGLSCAMSVFAEDGVEITDLSEGLEPGEPVDINNAGQIPNSVTDLFGDEFRNDYATAINENGNWVGSGSLYEEGEYVGVRGYYYDGENVYSVGALDPEYYGSGYSLANDVNIHGDVVGSSIHTPGEEAYIRYNMPGSGVMLGLGHLGGHDAGTINLSSSATAINDHRTIVGWSDLDTYNSGRTNAFVWTLGQGMTDLGTYRGSASRAVDINNNNQVLLSIEYPSITNFPGGPPSLQFAASSAAGFDIEIGSGSDLMPDRVDGIDVSHWQGAIDWEKVWGTGQSFAIVKATESVGFTDQTLEYNVTQGNRAGIAMGAYHFARPNGTSGSVDLLTDAFAEADYFSDAIRPLIDSGEMVVRPALDLEVKPSNLSWDDLTVWADAFMQRVSVNLSEDDPFSPAIEPMLYINSNYAQNLGAGVRGYDLWVANFTDDPTGTPNIGQFDDWMIWQYSESTVVDGITENVVDGNILNTSSYELSDILMPYRSVPDGPGGLIHDLDTDEKTYFGFGMAELTPEAMNEDGHVVGSYLKKTEEYSYEDRAFYYNGVTTLDLTEVFGNTNGWLFEQANGINDNGDIVGTGYNPDGERVGYVIVTEDSTAGPLVVRVDRQPAPTISPTVAPSSAQLVVLGDGTVRTDRATIVLSHGWNSEVQSSWPEDFAELLDGVSAKANIVAWDWSERADTGLLFTAAGSATPSEGRALAEALSQTLGISYSEALHFYGHSFGALVNRNAIDELHGEGFDANLTHVTIFDSADLGLQGNFAWTGAIPDEAAYIENYIGAFGAWQDEAVNIFLTEELPISLSPGLSLVSELADYHRYPVDWYGETILDPDAAPIGYRYNIIDGTLGAAPQAGDAFLQSLNPLDDELNVDSVSGQALRNAIIGRNLLYGLEASILTANLLQGNLIQIVGDVAIDFAAGVVADQLRVTLNENSPAYAWMNLAVPEDADYLSVDFTFAGLDSGDEMVLAIDDFVIFQLDSDSVENGQLYSTGLLDISVWDGETVELFTGLISAGESGGSITLENFTFYSFDGGQVPEPSSLSLLAGFGVFLLRRPQRTRHAD